MALGLVIVSTGGTACAAPAARSSVSVVDEEYRFESPGAKLAFDYAPSERRRLFDLSGHTVADDHERIALSDFAGDVIVINFWASWCGECRDEAAGLRRVAGDHADAPVQFVGINMDVDRGDATAFASEMGLGFPSIFDPSGRLIRAIKGFPSASIPHTIVLDPSGRVAHVYLGVVSAATLDAAVSSLLAET